MKRGMRILCFGCWSNKESVVEGYIGDSLKQQEVAETLLSLNKRSRSSISNDLEKLSQTSVEETIDPPSIEINSQDPPSKKQKTELKNNQNCQKLDNQRGLTFNFYF